MFCSLLLIGCSVQLSGTKFRQMLRSGEDIPEWFAFKSVVRVLREELNLQLSDEEN